MDMLKAILVSIMLTMNPSPDPNLAEQAHAWQVVGIYQGAQNDSMHCMAVAGTCKGVHMGEDEALIRAEDWERYARSLRGATISKL